MTLSKGTSCIWSGSAIALLAFLFFFLFVVPLALKAQNATPPAPAMPAAPPAPTAPVVPSALPAAPAPAAPALQPAPVAPTAGALPPQPSALPPAPLPVAPAAAPAPAVSAAPTAGAAPTGAMQTQNYLAAAQMISAMQHLRDQGKLTSNRALAASLRKVITDNSIQHPLAAPMGSKVVAVHKHPGDYVRRGEKIVTLLVDGKSVPILAKQDGVMQAINVSKGGILGNSMPTAANGDLNDGGLLIVSLINF
jgi:hypothetical protein